MTTNALPPLPTLPFGGRHARVSENFRRFEWQQAQVHSALAGYEPIGRQPFRYRAASIMLTGMRVVASAHSPVAVTVGENTDFTLLVPFSGWSSATFGGRELRCQAGATALYLPQVARTGQSGQRSLLSLTFTRARLEKTARAMLGHGQSLAMLALDEPRLLPLRREGLDFRRIFRQTCSLIDQMSLEAQRLELLKIDDLLCRAAVLLLAPGIIPPLAEETATGVARSSIERVCDYIDAHIKQPITLADLQRESGLKPRAIQIGFQKHFACTPRQWIVGRRLELAKRMLEGGGEDISVTAVALACGFGQVAAFTHAYRKRIGERPSETLRRVQARHG